MTLREYVLRWQEAYDKPQSRPTTYAAHGYIFKNHILPGLGEISLSELTVEQVGDFLEDRRRFGGHRPESPEYPGLGEHTMRHIHRLLQQCLDQAIRDGLIADNPARAFHYANANKDALQRIMFNLISNAIRYGGDGKYLGMFLRADQAHIYIDIVDRGRGIEKEFADSVFDRLFMMEDSRNSAMQGNGLGLTIAKNLALQLGGDITLESQPHQKTVFTITLKKMAY